MLFVLICVDDDSGRELCQNTMQKAKPTMAIAIDELSHIVRRRKSTGNSKAYLIDEMNEASDVGREVFVRKQEVCKETRFGWSKQVKLYEQYE